MSSNLPTGTTEQHINKLMGEQGDIYYLEYMSGGEWDLFHTYYGDDGYAEAEDDSYVLEKGFKIRLVNMKTGETEWEA